MTRIAIVIAAALALATTLSAVPAQAQRARVFVASYGSDSNPCTFLSPCRNFQQAVNTVAVGGEVTAIDSAGFGAINITQSVTITSPAGVEAGIAAASGVDAITINGTSAATITLRGLTLEGSGVGAHGIFLTSNGGGTLNIIDTAVKDFNNSGIAIQPGGTPNLTLTILNSTSLNNGGDGFRIAPTGSGQIFVSIDQTTANGNDGNGFNFQTTSGDEASQTITGQIMRSQASNNKNAGINGSGDINSPTAVWLGIASCYGTNNLKGGVNMNGGGSYILSSNTFNLNYTADINNAGPFVTLFSYGNNVFGLLTGTITISESLR